MRLFWCSVLLGGSCAIGFAQTPRLEGKKLTKPPAIDGIVDAAEWAESAEATGFVNRTDDSPSKYATKAFVAYDAESIYIAFVCDDPQPNLIRATEYRRIEEIEGNDAVRVLINPFGTKRFEDANVFAVSAGGGLAAEFAGGRAAKREWQGEWDGKARRTPQGWECEMRIPWKILRLPGQGARDIEFNLVREIPREQYIAFWSNLGVNERADRNGTWSGVDIPQTDTAKKLQLLPYQILGYDKDLGTEFNTGLDLRYALTNQITMLGTVNPDFKNVENAVLNLSFSPFERLANERRPFFVEGGSEFRIGGRSAQLFAPQRIRTFDFGAKVFGKLNDSESVSALALAQFGHASAGVARYRRTWGESRDFSVGLVHFENEDEGIRNTAGSVGYVDQGNRWGGDLIYNFTKDSESGAGKRFDIDLTYRDEAINGHVGWQQITSDFLPRIGFVPRKGFRGLNGSFRYEKQYVGGPLTRFEFESFFSDTLAEGSDETYLRSADLSTNLTLRKDVDVGLFYSRFNFLGERASIGGFEIDFPESDPYHTFSIGFEAGRIGGEPYRLREFSANYRFPNRLTLAPSLQFEEAEGERNTLHVIGLTYEIDEYQSIAGRTVIRDGKANWYLAYRRSGNLGAEYFVILGDPNADRFGNRIVLKAVFPVDVRL